MRTGEREERQAEVPFHTRQKKEHQFAQYFFAVGRNLHTLTSKCVWKQQIFAGWIGRLSALFQLLSDSRVIGLTRVIPPRNAAMVGSQWRASGGSREEESGASFTLLSSPFLSRHAFHICRAVWAAEGVDLDGSLNHTYQTVPAEWSGDRCNCWYRSHICMFWYFSPHSASDRRAPIIREHKSFCQAADSHKPSPSPPPQGPCCKAWSMLSYSNLSCLLGSFPMLHYPRGRGVSTERYFYYPRPRGGTENCVNIVIMFSAPPSYQVMNAKKKLKKKRYINSGTVSWSSEIRACTCLHGSGCRL